MMASVTWERCFLVFCCSFSLFCSNIFAYLDLEELKSVHYDIDILATPVLLGRTVKQEVLHLRSKFGQQYECQLPDMTDYEKEQEEEKLATDMGISELLKPMENAPCLIKTKDWWSYEYCHGRHVKQYHLENGKIKGDTVYLGHYESEMDWNNKTHKDAKRHRLNRYHSHTYVNGSQCDLTKNPRETEVRFLCAEGQGDSIFRVDEPSSCVYVLTIHTSRTCHHPYLRPPPSLKARPVLCYPVLEQEQYEKYLEIKQESTKNKDRHIIAFGSSESTLEDPPTDDTKSEPAEEPSTSQETPTGKAPLASLLGDLEDTGIDVEGLEDALAMGVDPSQLSDLVQTILKQVRDSVKTIDREVKGNAEENEAVDDDDDDDDDVDEEEEEDLLDGLDLNLLDADSPFDDAELEDLMEKDIGDLLTEYKGQISKVTSDPAEAERMNQIVDSIESTLGEINAVNSLIEKETAKTGDGEEGDKDDDESEKMVAKTLKNLINDATGKSEQQNKAGKEAKKPVNSLKSSGGEGVKLRVTKVSLDKSKNAKMDAVKETEVFDSNHRPIEDSILQQMEKAGIKTDETGKIEFRIMTYTPNDWPDVDEEDGVTVLTEEESTYFKNLVMGLLGRGAETTEQQRHDRLESNYQLVWDLQETKEPGTSAAAAAATDTAGISSDGDVEDSEP